MAEGCRVPSRAYRHCVAIKRVRTKVCIRVGFRRGRNIVALAVCDHQQAALLGRTHGVLKSLHARDAILLEECQLRLHGRDQIGHGIQH